VCDLVEDRSPFPQPKTLQLSWPKINGCPLWPESNSLLHVGLCYKSLATQILLIHFREMGVTINEIRIVVRVCHNLPAVVLHLVTSPGCSAVPNSLYLFGSHKKHLAGKQFAVNTDLKQAVTCWLQTLGTDFCCTGNKPWCLGTNKSQWCILGGLVCTICYTCSFNTVKSEPTSQQQNVCYCIPVKFTVTFNTHLNNSKVHVPPLQLHLPNK
jgi:hypothetical protein